MTAKLIAEGPFFAQLWESVLFDPNLKSTDKVVYAVLQRYAAQYGSDSVFPSQQTIADRIHMDRGAVNSALQNLEKYGHIKRSREGNAWVVTINKPVAKPHKPVAKPHNRLGENPTVLVGKPSTIRETQSNAEITEDPPVVPQGTKAKQAIQLPDGWTPDDELLQWAEANGVNRINALLETEQFTDHWTGKGERRKDWRATWRTWIRNSKRWGISKTTLNGHSRNNDPIAAMSVADEFRRQGL